MAAVLSLAAAPSAMAQSVDVSANETRRVLALLEGRACPALGDTTYSSGVQTSSELAATADRQIAYTREAMTTLDRLASDPEVSPRAKPNLIALGSWTVAQSLANWTLVKLTEQARTAPTVTEGQPHPAEVIARADREISAFVNVRSLLPEPAAVVVRLRAQINRCAPPLRAAIVEANAAQISPLIAGASTTLELDRIDQLYQLRRSAAATSPLVKAWEERGQVMRRQQAEAEARARANMPKPAPPPPPAAPNPAQVATARRFVAAANAQNETAALAELSNDVVLSTPQGVYSGKAQVAAAVRQQAASGRAGSMGTPMARGTSVVAGGSVGAISVVTLFEFDAANKIRRMSVSLN